MKAGRLLGVLLTALALGAGPPAVAADQAAAVPQRTTVAAPGPTSPTAASPPRWSRLAEPVFQTLARGQGLPNDVVYSVAQDAQGFVWIGTVSGLARWDGYGARVYRPGPPAAGMLPDGWIQVLQQDAAGRLWVGTSGGGVARYDAQQDRFDVVGAGPQGLSHVNVHAVLDEGPRDGPRDGQRDAPARLWIGSDGGLDSLDPQTLQVTRHAAAGALLDGLPRVRVMSLLRDKEGRLWVGTEQGLFRQRARAVPGFERVALAADAQPVVQALLQDSGGRVWIGTEQHGAFLWSEGQAQAQALRITPWQGTPLQDEHVTSISELRPGLVWLATLGQGVVEIQLGAAPYGGAEPLGRGWDARRIRHAPASPGSLADNTVRSLFRDRSGLMWLATDRGVSQHDPTQTAVLTMFGLDLESRPLTSRVSDPASRLSSEPARAEPAGGEAASRTSAEISWILPAEDGRLWLGTHKHGVAIVDPAGGPSQLLRPDAQRPLDALPQDIVMALATGPQREVYIATKRGLYRADADGRRVQRLQLAGRDPTASINTLWRDGETLWIGGSTDGLWTLHLPSGRAEQRSPAAAAEVAGSTAGKAAVDWRLTEVRITVLAPGPQGTLWVGTRNGLNRVDPQRGVLSRWLPERDNPQSLAGGFITAVHTDSRGRLWVGTFGAGLSIIDKPLEQPLRARRISVAEGLPDDNVNTLIEDAQGRVWASTDSGFALIDPITLNVRGLRASDGVVFPVYWTGSAARTAQGELVFGGAGGLSIVRPDAVADWRFMPPVVLTALTVGGQPRRVPDGQTLVIPPESNSFSVEFAALDYSDPARLRYATMLQGLDSDWTETDAQHRLLAHAKLPPGDYILLLRATNRQGIWVNSPLQLPLRVLPAWYQTWWARAGAVLCLLLGGALAMQLRTRRLRLQQVMLEQRVEQRTAQLRQVTQKLAEKSVALERKSLALEQASLTDPLTGLHNRRYLNGRLVTPALGDTGFAMLLIDIDHFKQINDSRGHAIGDAALVAVAQRLQQQLRPGDHLVRWGGEEFLLVAHGIAARGAAALAERLRRCIGDAPFALRSSAESERLPNDSGDKEQPAEAPTAPAASGPQGDQGSTGALPLAMTVSIGFACLPFTPEPAGVVDLQAGARTGGDAGRHTALDSGATSDAVSGSTDSSDAAPPLLSWEDALALADLALYAAKRSSRNCWMGLAAGAQRPAERLVQRALADPQACVAHGELQIISQGDPAAALNALRGH